LYMLAKYVPGDIKYIFTKFYRHISTNNEANRKSQICNFNFYFFHGLCADRGRSIIQVIKIVVCQKGT
jgi:hypothetical protein